MKKVVNSFTLAVLLAGHVNAASVCEDLARFTKAPGVYADGSGSARNPASTADFSAEIQAKYRPELEQKFRGILTKPTDVNFIKTVVSAFAFECDPQCLAMIEKKTLSGHILENSVHALASLVFEEILPMQRFQYRNQDARQGNGYNKKMSDIVFILSHKIYTEQREAIKKKIIQSLGIEESATVLQKVWVKVKPILKEVFAAKAKDSAEKEFMLEKLDQITLAAEPECLDMSDSKISMDAELYANANYNPFKKTINFCKGLIILNQSEFGIVRVLAHEATHAIDPCGASIGPGDFRLTYDGTLDATEAADKYPVENLIMCLRDSKSVNAKRVEMSDEYRSDIRISTSTEGEQGSKTKSGLFYQKRKTRDEEIQPPQWSIFCSEDGPTIIDQIGESVSDWAGIETVTRYMDRYHPELTKDQFIYGYSNCFRGYYSPDSNFEPDNDVHPLTSSRINKLLLANPRVRQQMGCPPADKTKLIYCPSDYVKVKDEENKDIEKESQKKIEKKEIP